MFRDYDDYLNWLAQDEEQELDDALNAADDANQAELEEMEVENDV